MVGRNVLSAREVKEGMEGRGGLSYIVRSSYLNVSFPKLRLRGSLVLAGKPLSADIID